MKLTGKTILITGANRGIGRAMAEALAQHPVNLLLGMRKLSEFKPIRGGKALSVKPIKMELSTKQTIEQSLKAAGTDLQELDILINNAGLFVAGPLEKQDIDKMYDMYQVNLVGTSHLTARLLPVIKKRQGKIVNNTSIAGYVYLPGDSTYSGTKAGLVGFSESLRRELSGTGTTVLHLVTPLIDTAMMDQVQDSFTQSGSKAKLSGLPADVWAKKMVKAIQKDKTVLNPGGSSMFSKILSRGPYQLLDFVSNQLFKK